MTHPERSGQGTSIRRVVAASMIGTVIEWFDFFIFGSMSALLLGPLFFPSDSEALSTMLSLATFAVAFFLRPLGAIFFGHFGDRIGRKAMLVTTLLLMGGATLGVGLLPTYASIGLAAPIMLVLLRMIQGFALGGEYGGAVLMIVENQQAAHRRGFFGAFLGASSPVGFLMSSGLIGVVTALTTDAQMAEWGWRVPFIASSLLVAVGFYIRVQIEESDSFKQLQKQADAAAAGVKKVPFLALVRQHPVELFKSIAVSIGLHSGYYLATVFALSYARTEAGFSVGAANSLVTLGAVSFLIFILIGGVWSDRSRREVPMYVGLIGFGLWSFVLFRFIDSGNYALSLVGFVGALAFMGFLYGPLSTYLAELFGQGVRYTGVSFGYHTASAITGGLGPIAATALLESTGSSAFVSVYALGMSVVALVGLLIRRRQTNWEPQVTETVENERTSS